MTAKQIAAKLRELDRKWIAASIGGKPAPQLIEFAQFASENLEAIISKLES